MNKYKSCTIFRINAEDANDWYVSGTTSSTKKVRAQYIRNPPKEFKNRYPNKYERKKFGMWVIKLESYSCSSKKELNERIHYWIERIQVEDRGKYNLINKPKGKTKKEVTKARNKRYEKKHKLKLQKKRKDKYHANKEEYLAKKKVKVTCGCGSCVQKMNLATHRKTKKHKKWESL